MAEDPADGDDFELAPEPDEVGRYMLLIADPTNAAILEALLMVGTATGEQLNAAVLARHGVEIDAEAQLPDLLAAGVLLRNGDDQLRHLDPQQYATLILATHRYVATAAAEVARDARADLVSLEDRLRDRGLDI